MRLLVKFVIAVFSVVLMGSSSWAKESSAPRIAVTDLAYSQSVSQYFQVAQSNSTGNVNAGKNSFYATSSSSETNVSGTYSYIDQRELGSFSSDIRGALLKGTSFRLVQGKSFDFGAPQQSKAEQVLHQIKTGKMAAPTRQPDVKNIISRIKNGEFNGADYVLFGTLSSIEFRDQISPLQGSSSDTYQFGLDVVADYSLISTKTYEIKASFSAQGAGNDIKILSNRGDIVRPNRGKVIREASQTLARSVFEQLIDQLGVTDRSPVKAGDEMPSVRAAEQGQVIILR